MTIEQLEPGENPRIVALSHDESAAEDEQDGGTVQRVAGNDNGIIDIHEQVTGVALGHLVGGFLRKGRNRAEQRQQEEKESFHRSDSMSSTSLSTASLSGICRRTGSFPR